MGVATDRAHRIGRADPVTVYRLIAMGTIEERVLALQREKRELFDQMLGDSSSLTRPFELAELQRLLAEPEDHGDGELQDAALPVR